MLLNTWVHGGEIRDEVDVTNPKRRLGMRNREGPKAPDCRQKDLPKVFPAWGHLENFKVFYQLQG